MKRGMLGVVILALTLGATSAGAQQLEPQRFQRWAPGAAAAAAPVWAGAAAAGSLARIDRVEEERPTALLALGGVAGGTAGFFGGLYAGNLFAPDGCDALCDEHAWGIVIGESLLLPVGVHIANGGRGNLLLDVLTSAAVGGAGLLIAEGAGDAGGLVILATPVAQLVSVILVERATSRR